MNRFNRIIRTPYKLYQTKWAWGGINRFRGLYCAFLVRIIRWYYHCDILYTVDVEGCYFCHKGFGTVIHPRAVLGKKVVIQHSVTIGEIDGGVPVIGDGVFIGARAVIIGPIKIGNDVKIGAGAVVTKDIPDNCTAVGVPAKIINKADIDG